MKSPIKLYPNPSHLATCKRCKRKITDEYRASFRRGWMHISCATEYQSLQKKLETKGTCKTQTKVESIAKDKSALVKRIADLALQYYQMGDDDQDDQSRTAATNKLMSSKSFTIKSLKLEIATDNEVEDKEEDNEDTTCTDTNIMAEQKLQNHHDSKGEDRKESKKKKRIAKSFHNANEEIVDTWIHNCYRPANIPIVKALALRSIQANTNGNYNYGRMYKQVSLAIKRLAVDITIENVTLLSNRNGIGKKSVLAVTKIIFDHLHSTKTSGSNSNKDDNDVEMEMKEMTDDESGTGEENIHTYQKTSNHDSSPNNKNPFADINFAHLVTPTKTVNI